MGGSILGSDPLSIYSYIGWQNNAGVRERGELGQTKSMHCTELLDGSCASLGLSHCILGARHSTSLQNTIRTSIGDFNHSNTKWQWKRCVGHKFIRIMTEMVYDESDSWLVHTRHTAKGLCKDPLLISTTPIIISPFAGKDLGAENHAEKPAQFPTTSNKLYCPNPWFPA